ncbi:class I SAM-dependent methyltransferase [Pelosinus sp. sgz500959]|uniref:class I SAM-dependent methyltransferase n=1 Tax=Pelosinus sp. sgz500959 TaxID=3242472 RepID=UPI00366AD1DF
MSDKQSWRTAFLPATPRLIEQYETNERRLFDDLFIKIFFSKMTLFMMQFRIIRDIEKMMSDILSVGGSGLILCRTRYIDDLLQTSIDHGIEQVVILGAGLDTRPYRIAGIHHTKIFEVDLPMMQDIKKEKIRKCLGTLPNHIKYVSIDFNQQRLDEVLEDAELDIGKPIFFICEAVTQYIMEEAIESIFRFISKTVTGSTVVFTYILKSVIDKTSSIEGANNVMDYFETKDQEWKFGLESSKIEEFLKQFKLTLIEDVGASYYQERYLKPMGRKLDVSEIERVVYAKRMEW